MAEPLKATFFAFRKREKGILLGASLTFAVLCVVLLVVFGVAVGFLAGGAAGFSPAAAAGVPPDINPGSMAGFFFAYLVFMVLLFILTASFEAACLRWMIRGERGGLFGLSLNADTWRVYGTYWLWLVVLLVGYIVTVLIVAVLAMISGLIGNSTPALGLAAGAVTLIIAMCAPIYLLVRTAPAAAISVGAKRFAFFDAWKVSRGRFWSLFGSFFLLWLVYIVLILAIWGSWFATMFGPNLAAVITPSSSDPMAASNAITESMTQAMATPAGMAVYFGLQLFGLVIALVFYVLMYGVNARAVIAAASEGKVDVVTTEAAETFS